MKNKFMKVVLTGLVLSASSFINVANASLMFITPSDVSSLSTTINSADALIKDATDISYAPGSPSSGGGGTSTYTKRPNNTWTFDFDDVYTLSTAYIWDYYGHSPTDWTLSFFDDVGGAGTQLFTYDFSILIPDPGVEDSNLHTISFAAVSGVRSVSLYNTNESARGGVGLEEVQFGGVKEVPEPSTLAILGLGLMGLSLRRLKKQA